MLGINSANFKTGRYSKHLPTQIAATVELSLKDKQLIECRNEIALVDGFLEDRLQKLYQNGETLDGWKLLGREIQALGKIVNYLIETEDNEPEDPEFTLFDAQASIEQMQTIQARSAVEYQAFELVEPMLEQRRKLVETEVKRLEKLEQMIPADKAFSLIYLLADIVKRHVTDPIAQQQIAKELGEAVMIEAK